MPAVTTRVSTAKSSKTHVVGGRVVSAKSKTGDPACSRAMSSWKTSGMTSAIAAVLGKCRAAARGLKKAESHRAEGKEARAQALEHRARSGGPVTIKDRAAKAKELAKARKEKQAAPKAKAAPPKVAKAKTVAAKVKAEAARPEPARSLVGTSIQEVKDYHATMSKDWSGKLNAKESGSVQGYTSSLYQQVNALNRGGKVEGGYKAKDIKAISDSVDKALASASLKESVTVFRGVQDFEGMGLKVGASLHDKTFLSTSLTPRIAERFAKGGGKKGAVIEIIAPKGSKGASVSGMTNRKDEHEVLFARGSTVRITGQRVEKGRVVFEAELSHD